MLISKLASDLEFHVHMISKTGDGYNLRVEGQVEAVRLLHDEQSWLEGDARETERLGEVREVISICKRVLSKR